MILRLCARQLRHGRKDPIRIAGEHDDIRRMRVDDAWDASTGDVFDRVGAARVFGCADVVVVWEPGGWVVDDVFEDRAEADGVEDLGFLRALTSREREVVSQARGVGREE